MQNALTAPDRLNLLLPWVNGTLHTLTDIRARVWKFLRSFDGTVGAGYIQVWVGAGERELALIEWPKELRGRRIEVPPGLSEKKVEWLRVRVSDLLRKGFPPEPGCEPTSGERLESVADLRFGVRRPPRRKPDKFSRESAATRRAYTAPGAYTLMVDGELSDLLPYLVAHLLTAPGMASVSRCPAPAPYKRDERCGKFVVAAGRGRPQVFCSDACRIRNFAEQTEDRDRVPGYTRRRGRRKR